VVICLELGADLHMAQLMPLPPTVSCFSKIQVGFTFLVPAHPSSPRQRAVRQVCVCVCVNNSAEMCHVLVIFQFLRVVIFSCPITMLMMAVQHMRCHFTLCYIPPMLPPVCSDYFRYFTFLKTDRMMPF